MLMLLLFAWLSAAKVPPAVSTPTADPSAPQVAAVKDYTDLICQMTIEGNLQGLNDKIRNGDLGNSRTTIKRMLNKLGVPNGKGCIINVMNPVVGAIKQKKLDPEVELERIKNSADQIGSAHSLAAKYPQLSEAQAQATINLMKGLNQVEAASKNIQTGELTPPPNAQ